MDIVPPLSREEFFKALNLSSVPRSGSLFRPCLKERLRSAKSSKENQPPSKIRSRRPSEREDESSLSAAMPHDSQRRNPVLSSSSSSSSQDSQCQNSCNRNTKVMILVRRTYYVEESVRKEEEVRQQPYSYKIRIQKPHPESSVRTPSPVIAAATRETPRLCYRKWANNLNRSRKQYCSSLHHRHLISSSTVSSSPMTIHPAFS
uniref:Uncharacterized protein n=1 Tax=Lepeophtheirus salmonis TaxID=72036 RepID=A0A0K2T7N5_LEPSM